MATAKRQSEHSDDIPNLAASARESEYHQGLRAVGIAVSKLAAPIVVRRGGGILVRLKSDWAAVSWPSALGRDGVLKLRAASTAALELQHRAPLLIERVNVFFGRLVITRLVLVQGPLPLDSQSPSGAGLRSPADCGMDRVHSQLSGIADPQLREALARLGRAVAETTG
jgi:Dna[CI] antecedent, DciA